jgi:hypothetical protein
MKLGLILGIFCGALVAGAGCGGTDTEAPSNGGVTSAGGSSGTGGSTTSGGGTVGSGANGGSGNAESGGGTSGSASGGTAGSASGGTAGISSGGGTGSDPLAKCKTEAASNPKPACANCACDHCLTELAACEADPSCVALRNCVQSKNCGCNDQLCVLTKCGSELTAAGGIGGPGTTKAIAVGDCTTANTCNCC